MKYKIGDRVKTSITDYEGVIIALDDEQDPECSKVKVKFDGIFGGKRWYFETMLNKIIEE